MAKPLHQTEALRYGAAKKFLGAGARSARAGFGLDRLGSEVTILEFLPRIAVGFDLELSNLLQPCSLLRASFFI